MGVPPPHVPSRPTTLAACATSERLLDLLVDALGSREVLLIDSPKGLAQAESRIGVAVFMGSPAARVPSLLPQLQELGARRPLLVIGVEPPSSRAGVSMWLSALPPPSMLQAIVGQLLREGPSDAWANAHAHLDMEGPAPGGAKGAGERVDPSGSGERVAVTRYRDAKHAFERDYYTRLLRIANGNVALAARLADKTRKEVYDALKRVGLDAAPYRQGTDAGER